MQTKRSKGFTPLEVKVPQGKRNQNKPLTGFTIIEILVVVAIITALMGVVLSNTTKYTQKGRRTAVRTDMAGALIFGAQYVSNGTSYSGICGTAEIDKLRTAITKKGGDLWCNTTPSNNGYCLCSHLPAWDSDFHVFCVDNVGFKDEYVNNCGNACSVGYCRY